MFQPAKLNYEYFLGNIWTDYFGLYLLCIKTKVGSVFADSGGYTRRKRALV